MGRLWRSASSWQMVNLCWHEWKFVLLRSEAPMRCNPLDAITGAAEMTRSETRAYEAMRALIAKGITDEKTLVDHAATIIRDDRTAQRVFDRRFKTYDAN